jgi:hypothetical protein
MLLLMVMTGGRVGWVILQANAQYGTTMTGPW